LILSSSRLNRRVGLSFLYFIQGIPQGLIYFALLDWLASIKFSISDIAIITSIASLPWVLKFIIGPFVDSYQTSGMGKRKPWIMGSLTFLSIAFFLSAKIVSVYGVPSPLILGSILFLVMLSTSVLDVATDGLAIDVLDQKERGLSNGLMWGFRTLGVSLAAILGSYLIKTHGLDHALLKFGLLNVIFLLLIVPLREIKDDKYFSFIRSGKKKELKLKQTIKTLYKNSITPSMLLLIIFCLTSNITSGMHYVSVSNLYINSSGWDHEALTKIRSMGLYVGIFSALAGGYLSDKHSPYRIILISQILIATTILSFVIAGNSISVFYVGSILLVLLSALGSFIMSASLSLCMGLTFKAIAATQFAFLMSIRHLSRISGEWLAGLLDYLRVSTFDIYLIMFFLSFLPIIVIHKMRVLEKTR
jgi:PAT family beta-lactamase induction signal transducer AmpG